MYKIIGADLKEYGPVTADQINQWITQGRVNALTKAKTDGGEWKALGEFPEFASALGNRAATSPTVPPNLPPGFPQPPKTSGMAIASLVLGIVGFFTCGIAAVVGLILGIVAMNKVKKSNGTVGGFGIALAGTIVSAVFLLMIPIGAAMMLPALAKAKERALTIQCMNNMKQLELATRIYEGKNNNHLPPAATWCDALKSQIGSQNVFRCPAAGVNDRCDYAFNANLDGINADNVNRQTVVFFESDAGWNVSGGTEMMLRVPRHGRVVGVVFADGHVEMVTPTRLASLRWNP